MSDKKTDRAPIIAPPPVLVLLCLILGFIARYFVPLSLLAAKTNVEIGIGATMVAGAIIIIVSARNTFIRHGTRPNPYTPTKAIATDGVYRFTRNPIYIAFLIFTLAFVFFTNSLWFVGSALLTAIALQLGVVSREEKYLHDKFGADYDNYRRRVRRWI